MVDPVRSLPLLFLAKKCFNAFLRKLNKLNKNMIDYFKKSSQTSNGVDPVGLEPTIFSMPY